MQYTSVMDKKNTTIKITNIFTNAFNSFILPIFLYPFLPHNSHLPKS